MNTKVNEAEMMKWFDKHKGEIFKGGKGFTGVPKKRRYAHITEVDREKVAMINKGHPMPVNVHYGDEYKKGDILVEEWIMNGHLVKLWANGNLTCSCEGWVFKRVGVKRECVHVREKYSELTGKGIPKKTEKPKAKIALANAFASALTKALTDILK